MILVTDRHRLALVTVEKSACTTLRHWFHLMEEDRLEELAGLTARIPGNIHKTCRRLYADRPIGPGYLRVAVRRNPWLRAASAYCNKFVERDLLRWLRIGSFSDFLALLRRLDLFDVGCNPHWRAQAAFRTGLEIDDWLSVETLQEDVDRLAGRLGVPRVTLPNWKKSPVRESLYRGLLRWAEADALGELYREDVAAGDYRCPPELVAEGSVETAGSRLSASRLLLYRCANELRGILRRARARQRLWTACRRRPPG